MSFKFDAITQILSVFVVVSVPLVFEAVLCLVGECFLFLLTFSLVAGDAFVGYFAGEIFSLSTGVGLSISSIVLSIADCLITDSADKVFIILKDGKALSSPAHAFEFFDFAFFPFLGVSRQVVLSK